MAKQIGQIIKARVRSLAGPADAAFASWSAAASLFHLEAIPIIYVPVRAESRAANLADTCTVSTLFRAFQLATKCGWNTRD